MQRIYFYSLSVHMKKLLTCRQNGPFLKGPWCRRSLNNERMSCVRQFPQNIFCTRQPFKRVTQATSCLCLCALIFHLVWLFKYCNTHTLCPGQHVIIMHHQQKVKFVHYLLALFLLHINKKLNAHKEVKNERKEYNMTEELKYAQKTESKLRKFCLSADAPLHQRKFIRTDVIIILLLQYYKDNTIKSTMIMMMTQ